MKLLKTTLVVALLASAGAAFAGPGGMGHGNHQPGERIVQLLSLDATRAAQVTTIMTDAQTQRRAVFESMRDKRGDATAREAARTQMKAIMESTQAKLAQVLTADELTKLKEARNGMRHHHGGAGPMRG